jgi:hypothetical protein
MFVNKRRCNNIAPSKYFLLVELPSCYVTFVRGLTEDYTTKIRELPTSSQPAACTTDRGSG